LGKLRSLRELLATVPDPRGRALVRAFIESKLPGSPNAFHQIERRRSSLVRSEDTLGDRARLASMGPRPCSLLYHFVRNLRPNLCVELGTAVGISGAYIAAALRESGSGRLISLEGNPVCVRGARDTFSLLHLSNVEVVEGKFRDTLGHVARENRPIDFLFFDGHKNGDAMLDYFQTARESLSANGIIVFDDIRWSEEMSAAWARVRKSPRTAFTVDLGRLGVWASDTRQ